MIDFIIYLLLLLVVVVEKYVRVPMFHSFLNESCQTIFSGLVLHSKNTLSCLTISWRVIVQNVWNIGTLEQDTTFAL